MKIKPFELAILVLGVWVPVAIDTASLVMGQSLSIFNQASVVFCFLAYGTYSWFNLN